MDAPRGARPGTPRVEIARKLGVPVYDVNQTGYPNRMREWNSPPARGADAEAPTLACRAGRRLSRRRQAVDRCRSLDRVTRFSPCRIGARTQEARMSKQDADPAARARR